MKCFVLEMKLNEIGMSVNFANKRVTMEKEFIQKTLKCWEKYFPTAGIPIAVFYSDNLSGALYQPKPSDNSRGYTCIFAQMARLRTGIALAFDSDNLGCFGSRQAIFGGEYLEDATVKLLCEIEKFKIDRDQVNKMHEINPTAKPTGKYLIMKPMNQLTEEDDPEIYFVFAKPDVISALHSLASFDDTRVDNVIVPFGSGCEGVFAFPLEESRKENPRVVLGGMDTAMRGCVKPELLTIAMPASRFRRMIENADRSFLDTYIWQSLRRRVEFSK